MAVTIDSLISRASTVRRKFSVLGWLIVSNVAIFVMLRLVAASYIFTGEQVEQAVLTVLEMPSSLSALVRVPWTAFTYMFTQIDLFHALFNMLWLYWFGAFFLDCWSQRRLVTAYVAGGLAGAAVFVAASNILPGMAPGAYLIGSSASVLSVVSAIAVAMPNREIGLMFFGGVKLKWIALVMVLFDLINIGFENSGGHLAHLGGAMAGVLLALFWLRRARKQARQMRDMALPDDVMLDRLLGKIQNSGYRSLTGSERKALFDISQRIRR